MSAALLGRSFCAGLWMRPPNPLPAKFSRIPNRFFGVMQCCRQNCLIKLAAVREVWLIV